LPTSKTASDRKLGRACTEEITWSTQQRLRQYIRDLLADSAKTEAIRNEVAPDELATFCLHAINAAGDVPSKTAVGRRVKVVLAGLRTSPSPK
jgi:hypothetical protein